MNEILINDLREIIAIDTTDDSAIEGGPFGKGNKEALTWFLNKASSYGLKVGNDDGYSAWAEYGEGKNIIGILGHLDVVPAGEGWDSNPFSLLEKDNKLYGRGVSDDKGPVIACLHALKYLKDNNITLKKRIRLIVGFNEECGSKCIKHYVLNNEIPIVSFTPDADFPVVASEKGIIHFELSIKKDKIIKATQSGTRPNIVPNKAFIQLDGIKYEDLQSKINPYILKEFNLSLQDYYNDSNKISTKGIAAHGAQPELGDNAIAKILALIYSINRTKENEFLAKISSKIGAEYLGINKEDKSGKLTLNVGMMQIINDSLVLTIDIRRPYSVSLESIINAFKEKINCKITILENHDPLFYDDDNLLVSTLLNVYRKNTGDYDSKPLRIGGGTYAKELPNCVGFGACMPNLNAHMHEPNEFMPRDLFFKLPQIYIEAIKELDEKF